MLEMMSEPQQWQLSSGSVAQVQTPSTIRAKELLELYRALSKPLTSVDDTDARLEILLQVKVRVCGDMMQFRAPESSSALCDTVYCD